MTNEPAWCHQVREQWPGPWIYDTEDRALNMGAIAVWPLLPERWAIVVKGALALYASMPTIAALIEWLRDLRESLAPAFESVAEAGETIAECTCPCCGASLELLHGDEPGQVGVLGTPSSGTFGDVGLRDPDAPCAEYLPGAPSAADCAGDGHYLCSGCVHLYHPAIDDRLTA